MNDLDILEKLFPKVSRDALQAFYEHARVVSYPPETTLCHQNAVENVFYILLEGRVDIYVHTEGQRFLMDYLSGGACFGEVALFLDRPRSADVVTSESVRVIEVDRDTFDREIITNVQMLRGITQLLVERVLDQHELLRIELAKYRKREQPAPKLFVSYSRRDLEFVMRLTADLEKHGIHTWIDMYNINPAESWTREIGRGLESSQAMLLILSPDALESKNVEDEWLYYLDIGKPVIPVLYRDVTMPYRLHKLQRLDFAHEEYNVALTKLIALVNTMANAP
jgi:CRP-like cAMP-binding protein